LQEEARALPFGAVWDFYCESKQVPVGENWLSTVKQYEKIGNRRYTKNLIQQVIAQVKRKEGLNNPNSDTFLLAGLLFEKFYDLFGWQDVDRRVIDAEVTEKSIAELREALISFAQQNRKNPAVAASLWALSKCIGYPLREFFLTEMKYHLEAKRIFPLHEAESALCRFGGGTDCNWPPDEGEDGYLEACRRFLKQLQR
jgi:hypothetical protein